MSVAAAAELVSSLIKANPQQQDQQQQQQASQLNDQSLLSYSHLENLIEESNKVSQGLLNGDGKQQAVVSVNSANSLNGDSYAKEQSQIEQQEDEKDAKSRKII